MTKVIGIGNYYKPQLWGTQGVSPVISFTKGNYYIEDLEITDHSPCSGQYMDPKGIVDGVSPACKYTGADYPFGLYAKSGIALAGSNITTKGLFVHRFASQNIWFSGNVENWHSINDVFVGSGGGGALTNTDGDHESFSGTNTMTNDIWAFGGCSEHYPNPNPNNMLDPANYHHCCDQTCQAYSLGGGFMQQSGSAPCGNWTITNSKFLYNLKTNIDFLHCSSGGIFNFINSVSEGSSGEAIKIANFSTINMEGSKLIGNAPVWYQPALKAIISPYDIQGNPTNSSLMMCRGHAVNIFAIQPGEKINYVNDDVTGNCTALIEISAKSDSCLGSAVSAINTKFIGGYAYDTQEQIDLFYNGGSDGDQGGNCGSANSVPLTMVNSSCYGARAYGGISCNSGTNMITADPLIVGEQKTSLSKLLGPDSYYGGLDLGSLLDLQPNSPLIKKGNNNGKPVDIGAEQSKPQKQ